jgi:hypothetical protein
MTNRSLFLAVALVVTVTVALAMAQAPQPVQPRIVSGSDIGFRVEGTDRATGRPIGTLVVRIDGEWVDVSSGGGPRLLK